MHYTGPEAYEVTAMAAVTGALVILEEKPRPRGADSEPLRQVQGLGDPGLRLPRDALRGPGQ